MASSRIPSFKPPELPLVIESIHERVDYRASDLEAFIRDPSDEERDRIIKKFIAYTPNLRKIAKLILERNFREKMTLTSFIARFRDTEQDIADHPGVRVVREIKQPIFIIPLERESGAYGSEIHSFSYNLFVPATADMLNRKPDDLLKEQYSIIENNLSKDFKKLLIHIEPRHTYMRLFGSDGFWVSYKVVVIDDPTIFWSPFFSKTPNKAHQPFMVLEDGEFVLTHAISRDEQKIVENVSKETKERATHIKGLEIRDPKTIEINSAYLMKLDRIGPAMDDYPNKVPSMLIENTQININYPVDMIGEDVSIRSPIRFSDDAIKKYSKKYKLDEIIQKLKDAKSNIRTAGQKR